MRFAACIETAVASVLNAGFRTADIARAGVIPLGTTDMAQKVIDAIGIQ